MGGAAMGPDASFPRSRALGVRAVRQLQRAGPESRKRYGPARTPRRSGDAVTARAATPVDPGARPSGRHSGQWLLMVGARPAAGSRGSRWQCPALAVGMPPAQRRALRLVSSVFRFCGSGILRRRRPLSAAAGSADGAAVRAPVSGAAPLARTGAGRECRAGPEYLVRRL